MDVCSEFRRSQNRKWRTFLFFREFKYVSSKDDVTLVVHASFDRLHMLEELCKYWEGSYFLNEEVNIFYLLLNENLIV